MKNLSLKSERIESVSNYLFENTSTIGLRFFDINRLELPRKIVEKETPFGVINVKESTMPSGNIKLKPEFEEIKKLSKLTNQSPFQIKSNIKLK